MGLIVFGAAFYLLRRKYVANFIPWLMFLAAALLIGGIFTFTPFVEWVAD